MSVLQVSQFQWRPEHVIGAKVEDVLGWNVEIQDLNNHSQIVPSGGYIASLRAAQLGYLWYDIVTVGRDDIVGQLHMLQPHH